MKEDKRTFEKYLSVILFTVLISVCFLQVLFRFVLNFSLAWTEELARFVFIALIYTGASLAAHSRAHVRVELIESIIPKKYLWLYNIFINAICCFITLVIGYKAIEIVQRTMKSNQLSAALQFPMWIIYSLVPILFGLISIRFLCVIRELYLERNKEA